MKLFLGSLSSRGRAPPGDATLPTLARPGARARPPWPATLGTRGHHTPHPAARGSGLARKLLSLCIHGAGHLPAQGMIARVRKQIQARSPGPPTGSHEGDALSAPARPAIRRAQARLRVPRSDLSAPRFTCTHPFTLGTARANTRDLGVPPAALLSPETRRSPGAEWLHLTRAKSATRDMRRVTPRGAVPAPRGVAAELQCLLPRTCCDPLWSRISPGARSVPAPVCSEGFSD